MQQYSSDGVRYWAAKARLGVDTAYDEALFANGKRLVTKLYNASKFVAGHLLNQDLSLLAPEKITEELDRSFIDHLLQVVNKAGKHFDNFEYADALQYTESFFWEKFCDNYLELIKVRAYQEEMTPGKISALATLKFTLSVLLRLFAPFVPFFTEEAWSWIFSDPAGKNKSVHTSAWPEEKEFSGIPKPEMNDAFGATMEILAAVRKVKSEAKVSVKTPLKSLAISGKSDDIKIIGAIQGDLFPTLGTQEAKTIEKSVETARFEVKAEL